MERKLEEAGGTIRPCKYNLKGAGEGEWEVGMKEQT